MRKRLTEANIVSLPSKAKRYLVYDKTVPGFAVRVSPTGKKTFVLVARFDWKHPARRALGIVGDIDLDDAQEKARAQLRLLARGPLRRSLTFSEIAEDFFLHIKPQRRARDVETCVRREFMSRWANKRIGEITRQDVLEVIDAAVARGSPYAAHHAWSSARRLFNWAIARGILVHGPCVTAYGPERLSGSKCPASEF